MPTLLEAIRLLDVLGFYRVVIPFILISAIIYGLLQKSKIFGDKAEVINALISISVALIFVYFVQASEFLLQFIPYVTAVLVVLFLIVMIFLFMGTPEEQIVAALKSPAVYAVLIALIVVIALGVYGNLFFPSGAGGGGGAAGPSITWITSPPIAGLIALTVIFAMVAYLVTRKPKSA